MQDYGSERVISGTFGEMQLDDDYMAETIGLQAKIKVEKSEVNQARRRTKGYKVTGYDCTGTVKMNKVTSFLIEKLSDAAKKGKTIKFTIISKLEDPDAFGAERVKLTGVMFDEIPLIDWESKKLGEESFPFTFEDWDLLDTIKRP